MSSHARQISDVINNNISPLDYDNDSEIIKMIKNDIKMSDSYRSRLYGKINEIGRLENNINKLKKTYFDIYEIISNNDGNNVMSINKTTNFSFNNLTNRTLWILYMFTTKCISDLNRSKIIAQALNDHKEHERKFRREIKLLPRTKPNQHTNKTCENARNRLIKMHELN